MKSLLITLALSATALMAISPRTRAQNPDVTQIKAVIERETTAWINRDAAAWAACWANVPEAGQLVSLQNNNGIVINTRNTKTDMPQAAKGILAGMGKPTGETFVNNDYLIRVKGDAAFAQFEQVVTDPTGKKEYLHETRYLEKTDGQWKIIHVGAVVYKPAN